MRQNGGNIKMDLVMMVMWVSAMISGLHGNHFRGGTINWVSEGGFKVRFYFRTGWTYQQGIKCEPETIGQIGSGVSHYQWTCLSKNCGATKHKLHNFNQICTGVNKDELWEQGRNDFTFTFPNTGPFTVGNAYNKWIKLSNGKGGGDWKVATTVDLRARSDTGTPNSSPESQSKPSYYVPFNCDNVRIKLPIIDPDNDRIRCRWAQGKECMSVCNALPGALLDEETCTLEFNTTSASNYINNGVYAVALTIEDFPQIPMTMGSGAGSTKMTPSDALSSVPVQFLVETRNLGHCDAGPRFVHPTPKDDEVFTIQEGNKIEIHLYADNQNDTSSKANKIMTTGPVNLAVTPVIPDKSRPDTFTTTVTWQTSHKDLGIHILCADSANDKGRSGEHRCFTIDVVLKGCKASPCQNNGKCVLNTSGHRECICRPGFSGVNCEIDIDDCILKPCPKGTYCVDGINSFTCLATTVTTTTTSTTTTPTTTIQTTFTPTATILTIVDKNYTGTCPLQYDHCDCSLRIGRKERDWLGLTSTGRWFFCFTFGIPLGLLMSLATFFCITFPCERHSKSKKRAMFLRKKFT